MRGVLPWIAALLVVGADRITKGMIIARIEPGSWVEVMPGFALTHIHNRGIAFSLFAGGGPLTRITLYALGLDDGSPQWSFATATRVASPAWRSD